MVRKRFCATGPRAGVSRVWGQAVFGALLAAGLLLSLAGCSNSLVTSLQISPLSPVAASGTTVQMTAEGVYGHGTHPSTTEDVTSQVLWSSSAQGVATINASGLVTCVSAGATTITAKINGFTGVMTATTDLTVTGGAGGTGTGGGTTSTLTSVAIIPSAQAVAAPGQTSQFIAIGTTSSGATINLTNQVLWMSSSTQIATIGASSGLATAVGQGTSTISALYTSGGVTLTASATFTVTAGTTQQYTALTVIPGSQAVSASGQTGQFIAIATLGTGLQEDVTDSANIKWKSSVPTVATVGSSTGLVTGVSAGTTTITAELSNPDGSIVSATATATVTLTAPPSPLLSLSIIPGTISVANLQATGQFLAIGTFSTSPYVRDLTNDPKMTWISSFPDVFPVSTSQGTGTGTTGGIVTAYGSGSTAIIAEYTDNTGSIQTATAQFSCPLVLPTPTTAGSCYPGSEAPALKATITIYNEGLNTTGWLVTAPSATGTPDVIHCGPGWALNGGTGGSVCAAPYPIGTTVLITAPAQSGVNFGGWSSSCTPSDANGTPLPGPVYWTAAGPNYCTTTLSSTNPNVSIGAIFN